MSKLPMQGVELDEIERADEIRDKRLKWLAELRTKIAARKANPPRPSGQIMFGRAETAGSIAAQLEMFDKLTALVQARFKRQVDAVWWINEAWRTDQNAACVELLDIEPHGKQDAAFFDAAMVLLTAETI